MEKGNLQALEKTEDMQMIEKFNYIIRGVLLHRNNKTVQITKLSLSQG